MIVTNCQIVSFDVGTPMQANKTKDYSGRKMMVRTNTRTLVAFTQPHIHAHVHTNTGTDHIHTHRHTHSAVCIKMDRCGEYSLKIKKKKKTREEKTRLICRIVAECFCIV